MSLNKTYFETKGKTIYPPIPDVPPYVPPDVPTPVTPDPGSVPSIPRPTFTGSVTIELYYNQSDPDTLFKTITTKGNKTVLIKDEVDLLHFRIPFNDTGLTDVNYAYMMYRYYYVHPVLDNAGMTWLQFDVDALMSWAEYIKNLYGIVERTGSSFNSYLNDPEMMITAYTTQNTIEATGGFSQSLNYYLLTIGGTPTPPEE